MNNNELYHHGIKGQRWGIRRFQNKDGSLTDAGRKRYDQEMDAVHKQKAKIAEKQAVLNNRKQTKAKLDRLKAEKEAVKNAKKALKEEQRRFKDGNSDKDKESKVSEFEARRAKALRSNDPKVVYKNRDTLTYEELNAKLNRINLETRLGETVPAERTGMQRINDKIKKGTEYYTTIDNAYSAVANSTIGKITAAKLGFELPTAKEKKNWSLTERWKNRNNISDDEMKKMGQRARDEAAIRNELNNREQAAKKKAEGNNSDKPTSQPKSEPEHVTGDVIGPGNSSRYSSGNQKKPDNYYDPIDAEAYDFTPSSNKASGYLTAGEAYVAAYLEDSSRR